MEGFDSLTPEEQDRVIARVRASREQHLARLTPQQRASLKASRARVDAEIASWRNQRQSAPIGPVA